MGRVMAQKKLTLTQEKKGNRAGLQMQEEHNLTSPDTEHDNTTRL